MRIMFVYTNINGFHADAYADKSKPFIETGRKRLDKGHKNN